MPLGVGLGVGAGGSGSGASVVRRTVSGSATGALYTITRLLGSSSTLSLVAGTNSNLTLSGLNIQAAAALGAGNSQTAVVREYDAATLRAEEYPVILTGQPAVSLSPSAASVSLTATPGTLVFTISGVPAGATPTLTPNDGRFAIAGDATAGWKAVVGLSALSAGSVNVTVSAAGAVSAAAAVTISAITAIPQASSIFARWNAQDIPAQANNSDLTTWTDSKIGVAATATRGKPKYIVNAGNGRPGVKFDGSGTAQSMTVAANTAFEAKTNAARWTIAIIVSAVDWATSRSQAAPFTGGFGGSGTSFWPVVGSAGIGLNNNIKLLPQTGNSGVHVLTYQISNNSPAFLAANTTAYSDTAIVGPFAGGCAIGGFGIDYASGSFSGTIHEIVMWDTALQQIDLVRLQKYAHDSYGGAYPWAGQPYYRAFVGDSLTRGYQGSQGRLAYPGVVASTKGYPLGSYTNVGISGDNYAGMTNVCVNNIDLLSSETGLPTLLVCGEWYNQARSTSDGDPHAIAATFLTGRKAADPTYKIAFWTSIDSRNAQVYPGAIINGRTALYNPYWDNAANRAAAGIDYYAAVHTNVNVGVNGACPTSGGNTYFNADLIHCTDPGYAEIASVVAPVLPG